MCYAVRNQRPKGVEVPLYQIECAGCGDECRVRRTDTEFCFACRIANDWELGWLKDHTTPLCETLTDPAYTETRRKKGGWKLVPYQCALCDDRFWPLRQSHRFCYYCTDPRSGRRKDHECNKCHKHNMPAPGMSLTCWPCVQETFQSRRLYLLELHKRRSKESR